MPLKHVDDLAARSASKAFRSSPCLELEQAEVEHLLRFLLDLLRVVQGSPSVLLRLSFCWISSNVRDEFRDRSRRIHLRCSAPFFSIEPNASTIRTQ